MTYDLSKLETEYNVKLDDIQKSVLSSLIHFVEDSDDNRISLCAPAGTGKTTCIKILYDILSDNGYTTICVVPTNKAKSIFNNGQNVETIHSLLNLRPDLNVLEFDATDIQFNLFDDRKSIDYDVLIVDECSMINSKLYDLLIKKTKYRYVKIIFCGDSKQLACIEDGKISKTFDNKCLYLTTVHRQNNGIVLKTINYLRNKPISKFKTVSESDNSIIVYDNITKMLNDYHYLFKLSRDFESTNLVKLITYSNNRITALNSIIRSKLYTDQEEYHKREILTAYDTYRVHNTIVLENSTDYRVVKYTKTLILKDKYPGYRLTVSDFTDSYITFDILSRQTSPFMLGQLAEHLEQLRVKAIKSKSKKDWNNYFTLYESFATPVDLVYNNRVVKRKTIDYGYCISVYKSQGSNYQVTLIDMENINRYATGEKLRQLQYVACSRTMNDLIIYQKADEKEL